MQPFAILEKSRMWLPQRVDAAGGKKTQNTSLCYVRIGPITATDCMKRRGPTDTKKWMSAGKGFRAVARWAMSEGLFSGLSLAKEQSEWIEERRMGNRDEQGG